VISKVWLKDLKLGGSIMSFEKNNEITISIPKNFAVEEASNFRLAANNFIKEGKKNFILDFSDCIFIDSTGLGVLVAVYKKCTELDGYLKLKTLNDQVLKIFKLTRLDKIFEII
jgi:anti-sigma B factor antagonist